MANKYRGEVTLKLQDKEYILAPTYTAIAEIEDQLDLSITKLISQLATNPKIKTVATIIYAGIQAYNETEVTVPQIGQMLVAEGYLDVLNRSGDPIINFLMICLTGKTDWDTETNKEKDDTDKKK